MWLCAFIIIIIIIINIIFLFVSDFNECSFTNFFPACVLRGTVLKIQTSIALTLNIHFTFKVLRITETKICISVMMSSKYFWLFKLKDRLVFHENHAFVCFVKKNHITDVFNSRVSKEKFPLRWLGSVFLTTFSTSARRKTEKKYKYQQIYLNKIIFVWVIFRKNENMTNPRLQIDNFSKEIL